MQNVNTGKHEFYPAIFCILFYVFYFYLVHFLVYFLMENPFDPLFNLFIVSARE